MIIILIDGLTTDMLYTKAVPFEIKIFSCLTNSILQINHEIYCDGIILHIVQ